MCGGLFADDASLEDPVGAGVHTGREAISAFWDQTRQMTADIGVYVCGPPPMVDAAIETADLVPLAFPEDAYADPARRLRFLNAAVETLDGKREM